MRTIEYEYEVTKFMTFYKVSAGYGLIELRSLGLNDERVPEGLEIAVSSNVDEARFMSIHDSGCAMDRYDMSNFMPYIIRFIDTLRESADSFDIETELHNSRVRILVKTSAEPAGKGHYDYATAIWRVAQILDSLEFVER